MHSEQAVCDVESVTVTVKDLGIKRALAGDGRRPLRIPTGHDPARQILFGLGQGLELGGADDAEARQEAVELSAHRGGILAPLGTFSEPFFTRGPKPNSRVAKVEGSGEHARAAGNES